jgi:hypothetical protein
LKSSRIFPVVYMLLIRQYKVCFVASSLHQVLAIILLECYLLLMPFFISIH